MNYFNPFEWYNRILDIMEDQMDEEEQQNGQEMQQEEQLKREWQQIFSDEAADRTIHVTASPHKYAASCVVSSTEYQDLPLNSYYSPNVNDNSINFPFRTTFTLSTAISNNLVKWNRSGRNAL